MTRFYFKTMFFITVFIIFYLSMIPNQDAYIDFGLGDKINHIVAFFTLSLLLNRSSSSYEKRLRNVIALIFFGIFIEIVQIFVSYRSSSIYDVLADIIGIFLFQLLYSTYRYVRYNAK